MDLEIGSGATEKLSCPVMALFCVTDEVGALVATAKYPETSSTKCDGFEANALTDPLDVGTSAMFDVTAPSPAFRVDAVGCVPPCGQSVRKPSPPDGTTVALSTYDWADAGAPQPLLTTFTPFCR